MNDIVTIGLVARRGASDFMDELSKAIREGSAANPEATPEIQYSYAVDNSPIYTALIIWRNRGSEA